LLWAHPAAAAEWLAWHLDAARQRLVLAAAPERETAEPPEVLLRSEAGQLILDLPETELATTTPMEAASGPVARVDAQQLAPDFARLALVLRSGEAIAPETVTWETLAPNQWAIDWSGTAPSPPAPLQVADERGTLAEIESVQMGLGSQLLVIADRPLEQVTNRRTAAGVYQIAIPNARLADNFRGPQLQADSPISQLNVRQQDSRTVVLLVQPADGIELSALNQPRRNLVALQFRRQPVAQQPRPQPRPSPVAPLPLPSRQPSNLGPLPRLTNSRVLVAIDPGHGGRDPGAIGIGGLREKDVVLPISREVASILQQQGVRVQLTRADDRYVTLAGRAQMANRAGAQVFVSIHANAINLSRPDVNGVETFYYSSGYQLAQAIQSSILRSISIGNRGVKRARFYVLRYTSMPSALVEVGFVTGRYDAPRLRDPAFRSQMAQAIARGILEYIQWRRL